MILGAEIGMIIMGLIAIFSGKFSLTKNRVVYGMLARLLGVLWLLPIPLSMLVGIVVGFIYVTQNPGTTQDQLAKTFGLTGTIIEGTIVVVFIALAYLIGWNNAQPPQNNQRRL